MPIEAVVNTIINKATKGSLVAMGFHPMVVCPWSRLPNN